MAVRISQRNTVDSYDTLHHLTKPYPPATQREVEEYSLGNSATQQICTENISVLIR